MVLTVLHASIKRPRHAPLHGSLPTWIRPASVKTDWFSSCTVSKATMNKNPGRVCRQYKVLCVCVCVWIIWGSKNLIFRLPSNEREQPKAFSLLAGCFGLDSRSICDGVRHMLLKFRKFADQDCRTSNAKMPV